MKVVQSYKTAMSRKGASAPLRFLFSKNMISGTVLDYGCGKGSDARYLKNSGFDTKGYDPYWNPIDIGDQKFDTILCTYVFNVLDHNKEDLLLSSIKNHLKDDGKAYITVRRDLKKDGYTSRGFQRIVKLNLPIVKENSGFCIYRLSV